MALRLFAATSSQGKLRDFRAAAQAHSIAIDFLPAAAAIPAPEENGATFAANAALKAVYYSQLAPGELVLADDSGLEVDALDGAPGVRSARFAADSGLVDSPDANDNSDVWNNIVLLQRLAGVPPASRTARYRCVLVVARDGLILHTARARSRDSSWKLRAAPAALATTRSSICPRSTARWPNSTLKPSFR
jgi:XTP/dITP diphosphohydrolase